MRALPCLGLILAACYVGPPATAGGGSGPGPAGEPGGVDLGDGAEPGPEGHGTAGLCEPCASQGDCLSSDDACVHNRDTGERYCAQACERGRCSAGFTCRDVGAGFPLQCIPEGGSCLDRPEPGGDPDPQDPVDPDPAGDPDPQDPVDPGPALGDCTGTPAECEAWQVINEYRTTHIQVGECNNALEWSPTLGQMAHDHQSGPFVGHSGNGYVENVGQAYGVRETAQYIMEYDGGFEDHCAADGSYVMSHHCATMFCNNVTVGVGVYEDGDTTYMTMVFGDAASQPSW